MIDITGNRKLIAACIMVLIAVGSVWFKGDVPQGLVSVLEMIFSGFVLGNIGEHVAVAYKHKQVAMSSESEMDLSSLDVKLDTLDQQNKSVQDAVGTIQQTLLMIIKRTGLDRPPAQ